MIIYSLGTVVFNHVVEQGLYIEEEHKWLGVGQTIRYALAGNPVIMENVRKGKPLTIIAQEDRGWITKANLFALKVLADQPLTNHILSLNNDEGVDETRTVRFKRSSYPLDLNPMDYAKEFYVGSISLIQVD